MFNTENKIANYQLVRIQVNSAQSRYYFPDLPNLRDAITTNIVSYNERNFTTDINGIANVNPLVFQTTFLTLYANGMEFIQKADLSSFCPISSSFVFYNDQGTFNIKPQNIDFSKSYVEIANLAGLLPAPSYPFSFSFGVWYIKP